jgi:hypothetical protein
METGSPPPAPEAKESGEPGVDVEWRETHGPGAYHPEIRGHKGFSAKWTWGAGPNHNANQGFTLVIGTVPEPSTWAMLLIGFAGLALAGWRRAQRQSCRRMSWRLPRAHS